MSYKKQTQSIITYLSNHSIIYHVYDDCLYIKDICYRKFKKILLKELNVYLYSTSSSYFLYEKLIAFLWKKYNIQKMK